MLNLFEKIKIIYLEVFKSVPSVDVFVLYLKDFVIVVVNLMISFDQIDFFQACEWLF